MKAIAAILVATLVAHIVGSAVLFGIISGVYGALFSPLLAVFGWFFLLPEAAGAGVQWLFYRPQERKHMIRFLALSAVIAAAIVAALGPKEEGSKLHWSVGYAIAAAAAAVASGFVIHFAKISIEDKKTEANQPPEPTR